MMSRGLPALLLVAVLFSACGGKGMQSREKIQQAIVTRLASNSGIDLSALDVTTTSVSFHNNMAYATVAFHPKNDTNVASNMLMKYTLQAENGKWVVVKAEHAQGELTPGAANATGEQLPPGHPPVGQPIPQNSGANGQQQ